MAHYLGRLKNLHSTTFKVLGMVELLFAFLLVLISVIALIEDEPVEPFILPVIPLVVLGLIQYFLFKESRNFRNVNGLMLVGLAWALIFIIGTFPYLLSGISPLDSLFESVSGFTTTGATVIRDIESMPISLQVWRSLTAWTLLFELDTIIASLQAYRDAIADDDLPTLTELLREGRILKERIDG